MATDVDVQYFSHLNGLVLSNNWGDMIRLLDTCLVNGLPLTSITSASIDAQGDITLNLYAAHNCMLFQIIELTGFAPSELNGKYRIKGMPTTTQLILKATHVGKSVTKIGTAKLASLGYEIIFRDANDVKRVYRAKNPRTEHPFIRVDETISDGSNNYNTTYAKSAMVGLIENMTHIDDVEDASKLQLPLNTTDFKKNWKITGTGTSVIRGWAKWYWATGADAANTTMNESSAPANLNRNFTLCGGVDAFYLLNSRTGTHFYKIIQGAGLIFSGLNTLLPSWFLMSALKDTTAATQYTNMPLSGNESLAKIVATSAMASSISNHTFYNPIQPDYRSGLSNIYSGNSVSALDIPVFDENKCLRGSLIIVAYSGKSHGDVTATTPIISESSMYIYDALTPAPNGPGGNIYFYLGEMK